MRMVYPLVFAAALLAGLCITECPASIERVGAFSRVVSAEVQGYVFYADGETAAEGVPVRIWDALTRQFIYETETDAKGFFSFPKLEPGKYFVTFDWVKLELEVIDRGLPYAQQPHDVIVVIPRGAGFMPSVHLHMLLLAASISETAFYYPPDRPPVVSP